MVNRKRKGNDAVLKCKTSLEREGWLVDNCEKRGRFVKGPRDLFGLFDLIAIKEDAILFIQVTMNTPHTHKRYKEFCSAFCIPTMVIQQWVWKAYKGFDVYSYDMIQYRKEERYS